jgi:hypothetical protein
LQRSFQPTTASSSASISRSRWSAIEAFT